MNGRFLALALGLTAMTVFGSNMAYAETTAPEATAKGTAEGASKAEHAGKHKEHGKKSGEHEKAHHDKDEAKEAK